MKKLVYGEESGGAGNGTDGRLPKKKAPVENQEQKKDEKEVSGHAVAEKEPSRLVTGQADGVGLPPTGQVGRIARRQFDGDVLPPGEGVRGKVKEKRAAEAAGDDFEKRNAPGNEDAKQPRAGVDAERDDAPPGEHGTDGPVIDLQEGKVAEKNGDGADKPAPPARQTNPADISDGHERRYIGNGLGI